MRPRESAPGPCPTAGPGRVGPGGFPPVAAPASRCLPTVRSRPRPGPARGSGLPPAARPRRLPWRRRYLPPGPQPGPGGGERGGWGEGGRLFIPPPLPLPFAATSADVTGRPPPSCTARGREMEPRGGTQRKGTAAPEPLGPGGTGTSRGRRGGEGRAAAGEQRCGEGAVGAAPGLPPAAQAQGSPLGAEG